MVNTISVHIQWENEGYYIPLNQRGLVYETKLFRYIRSKQHIKCFRLTPYVNSFFFLLAWSFLVVTCGRRFNEDFKKFLFVGGNLD